MSNTLVLYIGQPEAGQALAAAAEARGSYVYLPQNLMDALGIYISYFPQITVIDMAVDYAEDVLYHLRSVDAKPIVLLGGQPRRLASVYRLPAEIKPDELLTALERIGEPQRVSNGLYHYA